MKLLDTKAISARANEATPGPWHCDVRSFLSTKTTVADISDIEILPPEQRDDILATPMRDATFIAAARTDVPALCDEVERLRKALMSIEPVLERCVSSACAKTPPDYAETCDALDELRAALAVKPKDP